LREETGGRWARPDEVRIAVLQQEGEWALVLAEPGTRATIALKLLRQALNLSLGEVGELRKRLPGTVVTGTRAEMERLLGILSAEGFHVSVTRLSSTSSGS
jgi:hypothetical protein